MEDILTSPASLVGLPALSLPVSYTAAPSCSNPAPFCSNPASSTFTQSNSYEIDRQNEDTKIDSTLNKLEHRDDSNLSNNTSYCNDTDDNYIEGVPISLQLIGAYGSDAKLLRIGSLIENIIKVPCLTFK